MIFLKVVYLIDILQILLINKIKMSLENKILISAYRQIFRVSLKNLKKDDIISYNIIKERKKIFDEKKNNFWKFKIKNEEGYCYGQSNPWLSIPFTFREDMKSRKKFKIECNYNDLQTTLYIYELLNNFVYNKNNKNKNNYKEIDCPFKINRF